MTLTVSKTELPQAQWSRNFSIDRLLTTFAIRVPTEVVTSRTALLGLGFIAIAPLGFGCNFLWRSVLVAAPVVSGVGRPITRATA